MDHHHHVVTLCVKRMSSAHTIQNTRVVIEELGAIQVAVTADDGKCDEPYDVKLHIPKQPMPKGWMKELKLISADRQILQCHRKWVNDRLINAAQQMLRKQYGVPGLEDVSKGETLSMDVHKGEFIQILNVGKVHWVTVSTIDCNPGVIKVYDSGGKYITYRNQEQIAALLFTQQNTITVQFMGVMRQYGSSDWSFNHS